jgi:hypothetical protein
MNRDFAEMLNALAAEGVEYPRRMADRSREGSRCWAAATDRCAAAAVGRRAAGPAEAIPGGSTANDAPRCRDLQ